MTNIERFRSRVSIFFKVLGRPYICGVGFISPKKAWNVAQIAYPSEQAEEENRLIIETMLDKMREGAAHE